MDKFLMKIWTVLAAEKGRVAGDLLGGNQLPKFSRRYCGESQPFFQFADLGLIDWQRRSQ